MLKKLWIQRVMIIEVFGDTLSYNDYYSCGLDLDLVF